MGFSHTGKNEPTYSISEVSRIVDLSQKRIRDYEKEGFLRPQRETETNNRIYTEQEIAVIRRIKELIHQGFTLRCLKNLMVSAPCWVIFDCEEKAYCPAYKSPGAICYQLLCPKPKFEERTCETCPVFLTCSSRPVKIF